MCTIIDKRRNISRIKRNYSNYIEREGSDERYIESVSGPNSTKSVFGYGIIVVILATFIFCSLCSVIACITGGVLGFVAGKFHNKSNKQRASSYSSNEEV
eukprot:27208_1